MQKEYNVEAYDAGLWFTGMSAQTNCRVQGNTTQGMYIAGADGTAYCWKNTPGISDTLRFMDKGLIVFKKHPPQKVEINKADVDKPFSTAPKPFTSVIAVYSRVRPIPAGADRRNRNVGRDYLWISRDEVREMLDAARDDGHALVLPATLVARLCRFALVDSIRGEPDFWDAKEIKKAAFVLKKIDSKDTQIRFSFNGDFSSRTAWYLHGIDGHIDGEFTLDGATEMVSTFRAYAKCKAWGSSEWSTRGVPQMPFSLVFGFCDEKDPAARAIPPAALSRHQDYASPKFPVVK